jgi:hypothetical protein
MTEEEFKQALEDFASAWYTGDGREEAEASILAAFAELRAERDLLREAVEAYPEWSLAEDGDYDYMTICLVCKALWNEPAGYNSTDQRMVFLWIW